MRERAVALRPHEVRGILDGRQTQFRRVLRWPLTSHSDGAKRRIFGEDEAAEVNRLLRSPGKHPCWRIESPYGAPGGLLWVQESHAWADYIVDGYEREDSVAVAYRADGVVYRHEGEPARLEHFDALACKQSLLKWRPSKQMPRWAARLFLRVTEVQVGRLQALTEADAKAEGMTTGTLAGWPLKVTHPDGSVVHGEMRWSSPSHAFAAVWDTTSGKRPGCRWVSNPWVWVVSFERVEDG
jgi:hypothetical protein